MQMACRYCVVFLNESLLCPWGRAGACGLSHLETAASARLPILLIFSHSSQLEHTRDNFHLEKQSLAKKSALCKSCFDQQRNP